MSDRSKPLPAGKRRIGFTVSLPPKLYGAIGAEIARTGESRSSWVEEAVRQRVVAEGLIKEEKPWKNTE